MLYPGAVGAIVPVNSPLSPLAMGPGDWVFVIGKKSATATQSPATDATVTYETPVAPYASIAITSGRKEAGYAPSLSVQILFNANPGAFNVQLQEADTDADGCYITPSNSAFTMTTSTQIQASGIYVVRADLVPLGGRFQRLFIPTNGNPNAVGMIAKLSLMS